MPNPDVLIGLAEAAVRLKRPYQDVHRLLCTGVLTGEKRGGRWFVRQSTVEDVARRGEKDE